MNTRKLASRVASAANAVARKTGSEISPSFWATTSNKQLSRMAYGTVPLRRLIERYPAARAYAHPFWADLRRVLSADL